MKIYHDKSEIYAAIRSANRKLKELREEISAEDIKRKEAFGPVRGAIEDKIIKLEAKAGRIESVRLVKLKNTAAAFDTQTFDFMDGYKGVATQKL